MAIPFSAQRCDADAISSSGKSLHKGAYNHAPGTVNDEG
jgi:hypothetical protein